MTPQTTLSMRHRNRAVLTIGNSLSQSLARGASAVMGLGMVVIQLTAATLIAVQCAQAETTEPEWGLGDTRAVIATTRGLPPDALHELYAVRIDGIDQWISVRGAHADNPVLLFIHGGPGWPMMPMSWTFQRPWEDFFTVVQWDQRSAGKTYARNLKAPDADLSIELMVQDAEEMVRYLLKKYAKPKIILVGHSWGSVLGVKLAQAHPEWFYAYVGIGQLVNMQRNETESYRLVLASARERDDQTALAALRAIAPYPEPGGVIPPAKLEEEREWVVRYGGMRYGIESDDETGIIALSPDYTADDAKQFEPGVNAAIRGLWPKMATIDFDNTTVFRCPIILFAGRHDMTTPTSLAAAWYTRVRAPSKKLIWFENSSHYVVNEEPGLALDHLVHDVRPLAYPQTLKSRLK